MYLLPKKFIEAVTRIVNICEIRGSTDAYSVNAYKTSIPEDKLTTSNIIKEPN